MFLYTSGNIVLEDMTGWSKKEIQIYLSLLGINVMFEGNGYCYDQSVLAGTDISNITDITIKLKDNF